MLIGQFNGRSWILFPTPFRDVSIGGYPKELAPANLSVSICCPNHPQHPGVWWLNLQSPNGRPTKQDREDALEAFFRLEEVGLGQDLRELEWIMTKDIPENRIPGGVSHMVLWEAQVVQSNDKT